MFIITGTLEDLEVTRGEFLGVTLWLCLFEEAVKSFLEATEQCLLLDSDILSKIKGSSSWTLTSLDLCSGPFSFSGELTGSWKSKSKRFLLDSWASYARFLPKRVSVSSLLEWFVGSSPPPPFSRQPIFENWPIFDTLCTRNVQASMWNFNLDDYEVCRRLSHINIKDLLRFDSFLSSFSSLHWVVLQVVENSRVMSVKAADDSVGSCQQMTRSKVHKVRVTLIYDVVGSLEKETQAGLKFKPKSTFSILVSFRKLSALFEVVFKTEKLLKVLLSVVCMNFEMYPFCPFLWSEFYFFV